MSAAHRSGPRDHETHAPGSPALSAAHPTSDPRMPSAVEPDASAQPVPHSRSEVGRVEWRKVGRRQYRFVLVAVGPRGRYTAAQSPTFRGTPVSETTAGGGSASAAKFDDQSSDAFNALASALWQQGWEPTELGRSWHDATYRRAVVATATEALEAAAERDAHDEVGDIDGGPEADHQP